MRGLPYAQRNSGIRLSDRRQVDLICDVVARQWEAPFRHRVADLSTQGLWLETSFPLPLGEEVVICMEPEGWRLGELFVFARVTRRNTRSGHGEPRGMGLTFLDLVAYEREEIVHYLRRAPTPPKVHWSQLAERLLAA